MGSIINSDVPKHDNVASLMTGCTVNSGGEFTKQSTKKEKKFKDKTLGLQNFPRHCHVIKGVKNEYILEAKWTFMREDGDDRKFLKLVTGYVRREYFSESGYDPYFYVKFVKKYIGNDRDLFYKGFDINNNIISNTLSTVAKSADDIDNENENDNGNEYGDLVENPVVAAHPAVNPYNHIVIDNKCSKEEVNVFI